MITFLGDALFRLRLSVAPVCDLRKTSFSSIPSVELGQCTPADFTNPTRSRCQWNKKRCRPHHFLVSISNQNHHKMSWPGRGRGTWFIIYWLVNNIIPLRKWPASSSVSKPKQPKENSVENSHFPPVPPIAPPFTARKYLMSVCGILPECLHENKGTHRYMFIISHFFYKRYSAVHFLLSIFLFNFLEPSLRMISGHSFLYLSCWLLPHGTHRGPDSLLLVNLCFSPMLQWLFSTMNHSTCLLTIPSGAYIISLTW